MHAVRTTLAAGLFAAFLLPVLGIHAQAQGLKIGFIDDEVIKQKYKPWQRAQEQWEIERKAWDDEAVEKQSELQDLVDEYEKQKLILSDEKKQEREAAIRAKKDALDAFTQQIYSPGGTAERKQEQLIMPLLENVSEAIRTLAESEGYDVIFTMQSGIGYIKESYDVTDKVLEYLDKLEE